jgi:hypothetical protein
MSLTTSLGPREAAYREQLKTPIQVSRKTTIKFKMRKPESRRDLAV